MGGTDQAASSVVARQFTLTVARRLAAGWSRKRPTNDAAALATVRPISRPSVAAATSSSQPGSARSATTARVGPSRSAATSATESSRSTSTTEHPRARSASVKASPTPCAAPVTSAQGPYRAAKSVTAGSVTATRRGRMPTCRPPPSTTSPCTTSAAAPAPACCCSTAPAPRWRRAGCSSAPFADRFDLVAHDQRGVGLTSVPDGPYTMADYAADAVGLLDHLGWDQARVVGISFGGMVAQELAVTHPSRVERLALACTSSGGGGGSSYPLHELAQLPPDEQAAVGPRILDTRFTPEFLEAHPGQKVIADAMGRDGRPSARRRSAEGRRCQLEARRHHDVWDRLSAITCPTLVAGGRYDGIAPPANAEAIASRIAGADLRLYEGGHAFFAQDRTALPEIIEFLALP